MAFATALFGFLGLLLAFALVISLAFAYAVAGVLTAQIGDLSRAAMRLAAGDMTARVGSVHGPDEIGQLIASQGATVRVRPKPGEFIVWLMAGE